MKNKILSIISVVSFIISIALLLLILIIFYWFKRGDACLTQVPFYDCHTQNKFSEINTEFTRLSDWSSSLEQKIPNILNVNNNENIFTYENVNSEGDVGWTRILKEGNINNSLGFYTNNIPPILTPLSENTLIGSAWQWPQDSKFYNGPFLNYYLDFKTRKTIELSTKGRLVAKSQDGKKVVFLESSCVKEHLQENQLASCNNLDLSLRLIDLTPDLQDIMINHYYAMNQWFEQGPPYVNFLDFGKVVFSPNNARLAIEIKVKELNINRNISDEYWTLLIADTKTGEIIKRDSRLSKNSYEYIFWLDNENIIY
ncbi:MAG: hypothetical protein WC415_03180 [Patescibacteria group bacterium]|jgi:hypothetical protein